MWTVAAIDRGLGRGSGGRAREDRGTDPGELAAAVGSHARGDSAFCREETGGLIRSAEACALFANRIPGCRVEEKRACHSVRN